jgi:bifunctional non-homologous end joining protein LigD
MFDSLPPNAQKQLRRRPMPKWCNPMLATLAREAFSDPEWIFETKLDGIRCLSFRNASSVNLYSRNQLKLNHAYPDFVAALLKEDPRDFIVDGEIVALKGGISRFELLQRRMLTPVPVYYYLFDILYLNGYDLTGLELRYRKEILKNAFTFNDPLRFSPHRSNKGEAYYREACRKGLEGVIAKRAASHYVHRRSPDWLKFKCENQQEFVIVGYTDPEGERTGLGALLVGVYDHGKLRYAGKVGTGFDMTTLRTLERQLSAIQTQTSPCVKDKLPKTKVHWVRLKYVAQIAFTEWTRSGKLRHPRYLGLRTDKKPSQVVRETPS